MNLKDEVRIKLIESKLTLTDLVKKINSINGTDKTVQNLDSKLRRETLRYTELVEIADILGYDIQWVKRESQS